MSPAARDIEQFPNIQGIESDRFIHASGRQPASVGGKGHAENDALMAAQRHEFLSDRWRDEIRMFIREDDQALKKKE